MAASLIHDRSPLIRKLEATARLTGEELRAVESLPMKVQALKADQDIVRTGDQPSRVCLVLQGYTATYKMTGEGKRQIQGFHVPGDIPDLHGLHLRVLDYSVATITPCKVAFIPHEALLEMCSQHPRIMQAFWRQTLIDGAVFREWMTNIGQREAYPRLAHFLCEWTLKLRTAGLAEANACDLPMTQIQIADAMGISGVHVNRVLKSLRGDGLIKFRGGRLEIPDLEKLQEAGDFDPMYLHQNTSQRAA